jgi:hypothetical protein
MEGAVMTSANARSTSTLDPAARIAPAWCGTESRDYVGELGDRLAEFLPDTQAWIPAVKATESVNHLRILPGSISTISAAVPSHAPSRNHDAAHPGGDALDDALSGQRRPG